MKNFFSTVWTWIVYSSANPEKYSATLKFALLGVIPYILATTSLACGFHLPHACISIDQNALVAIVEAISNVAFWSLSVVAGLGTIWALLRKTLRTADGTNASLNAMQ